MAVIRKSEIRHLNKEELEERLKQLKFEILKTKAKGGQATAGTKRIKEIKKTIARIHAKLKDIK
ncbi:MAG: 50S ribosomal protein L29 [archaeon]|nr:MAG: 50S ribosomal protein L29 [archaeon]